MTIVRWIFGVIAALLAVGMIGSFVLFVALDIPLWIERARRLRGWLWFLTLLWFNIEVWGRVVYTLVNWAR